MEKDKIYKDETSENILQIRMPNDLEILRVEANGDIFYKGRLIENDKEIVDGFREFFIVQGYIKRNFTDGELQWSKDSNVDDLPHLDEKKNEK